MFAARGSYSIDGVSQHLYKKTKHFDMYIYMYQVKLMNNSFSNDNSAPKNYKSSC